MNHEIAKNQLFDLYDGELVPEQAVLVRAHLDVCAECQGIYQGWGRTAKNLFAAPVAAAPSEFFVNQVMKQIHQLEAPKTPIFPLFSFRWFVPAFSVAMLLLVLLPAPLPNVSMDNLLFQDNTAGASWVVSNRAITADDTLQFVMEGV